MQRFLSIGFLCLFISHSSFADNFVSGEFLVKLKPKTSRMIMEVFSEKGFSPTSVSPEGRLYKIKSPLSFQETMNQLKNISSIEYAEPNFILSAFQLPNDPQFKEQWGLKNSKGFDVRAESLWKYAVDSKDVIIAVIDTGISMSHPDLKGNLWINEAEAQGQSGIDDDKNGFIDDINGFHFAYPAEAIDDKHGHGTHCAGVIAARGNNAMGVSGLLWEAKVMAVGYLDKTGYGPNDNAVKAIDYAVRMGAKVISASWGGNDYSQAMKEAIMRANEADVVFVAAAGNSSKDIDKKPVYSASYDVSNIISVAALNRSGKLSWFSNRGAQSVDIAAPGESIKSTYKGVGYKTVSGTSMAAPFVAAAAAMTLANHPEYTPEKVRQVLMNSSTKLPSLNGKVLSGGLLNAIGSL